MKLSPIGSASSSSGSGMPSPTTSSERADLLGEEAVVLEHARARPRSTATMAVTSALRARSVRARAISTAAAWLASVTAGEQGA